MCVIKFKQVSTVILSLPLLCCCRKLDILNSCLWISRLSWRDFPLCYYLLRNLCLVSTCMRPSVVLDFFNLPVGCSCAFD